MSPRKAASQKRTRRTAKKRADKIPPVFVAESVKESVGVVALPEIRQKALDAYRIAGTIVSACEAAGIGRRTWYDWMETDPEFARQALEIGEDTTDELEVEAIRRAKSGSDTLLIFLLKSRRPHQYGDKLKIDIPSHPEFAAQAKLFVQIREDATLAVLQETHSKEAAARIVAEIATKHEQLYQEHLRLLKAALTGGRRDG